MDAIEKSALYGFTTALALKLKDYHDKYYDVDQDNANQCKEWSTARDQFLSVIQQIGEEMSQFGVHLITVRLGIRLHHMRGEVFEQWAEANSNLFQRIAAL